MGPLPKKNNCNQIVLAFNDQYMNLRRAISVTQLTSTYAAAVFLDHCVSLYGAATYVLTDYEPQLISQLSIAICEYLCVRYFTTAAYRSPTNS